MVKYFIDKVVQISLLCALAGQMAGDDNSGHDSHCHPQNLRALLPLQIIAEEEDMGIDDVSFCVSSYTD